MKTSVRIITVVFFILSTGLSHAVDFFGNSTELLRLKLT